jgi:transcription-repair coupling factor (superfamily II helicase)
VVSMLTELRYVISVLAQSPILIDTGHMVPKYQLRTYQDQQNENANELSQLQNYHAKVKILTREHLIQTMPPPAMPPEHEVQTRIAAIKARMLAEGYTRNFREVAEEIAKRHELLRHRPHSDAPPPSSTTGRPPRRLRQNQKPPPAFS